MRKYLGVSAVIAALCVMSLSVTSWAQTAAPAQTPPATPAPTNAQTSTQEPSPATIPLPAQKAPTEERFYPRYQIFLGGTYAEAGLFNAGHWAGLYGWDSSLSLNATSWLGIVVEGGQYFGTSKIPTLTPAPFPPGSLPCYPDCPNSTFNVDTKEYNFLFGAQFSRRKYEGWTPFGEILYGHQGTRGQITSFSGQQISEIGTGRAIVAGGGADRQITPRLAIRFKADYLQTGTAFPKQPHQLQDNFRFSVGLVINHVKKKKRRLEDVTDVAP